MVELPKYIEESIDLESKETRETQQLPNFDPETNMVYREFDLISLKACFKSIRFYQYLMMLFLASQFGGYFSYIYKSIGLSVKISDKTLSMASSASGLVQLFSRIGFGYLYDKFGFKKLFYFIMTINALNGLFVY